MLNTHWHTYPKTPKMNAHCERFNKILQDEFIDYCKYELSDYLFWYNAKRPHYSLGQIPPIEYIKMNEDKYGKKCKNRWTHTSYIVVKDVIIRFIF